MTINADAQKLEPGNIIELFEADLSVFEGGSILRFHGHPDGGTIVWDSEDYTAWPIKAEGFARTGSQPPRPKLTIGNVDRSITALCMMFQDLVGVRITRRRTFKHYLDAINFIEGNPTADPDQQFPEEIWIIDRKSNETPDAVEFELCSAMEFNGARLPGRQILANVCPWIAIGGYRGPYCGYAGDPVAKLDDTPTSDAALDDCGGRPSSCKLRFGSNGKLPAGFFPAAGLIRA